MVEEAFDNVTLEICVISPPLVTEICPPNDFMDDDLRSIFLDKHNSLRSSLALGREYKNGNLAPTAANMQKMTFLEGLCRDSQNTNPVFALDGNKRNKGVYSVHGSNSAVF
ncbi:hypothetical protein NECAME_07902 [Necator americanus]|uniref:SCP domain-containing protein n=1 Tax=Necator americanus TaxID=51031 RepID=W2TN08_NECAM|nr:hypothetical protein NECAME_07902 [Necator americanus]ETN82516.1 hypothetical protein NECAME_07902 [Necator americanus]